MPAGFRDFLLARLGGLAQLSPLQLEQLEAHCDLLLKWNRTINLTSIERLDEMVERHYCESLFLSAQLPSDALSIVDIGSGAGFPGIPVAVHRSRGIVTLVESHQRKAVFLREATRGLGNVRVISRRAESVEDTFDWVISRAVSYGDLSRALANLAPRAALLTGIESPTPDLGFDWAEPVPVPWGKQRYVRVGERKGGAA